MVSTLSYCSSRRVKIKSFIKCSLLEAISFLGFFRLLFTNIDGFNACKTCVYIARLMVLPFYFIKLSWQNFIPVVMLAWISRITFRLWGLRRTGVYWNSVLNSERFLGLRLSRTLNKFSSPNPIFGHYLH